MRPEYKDEALDEMVVAGTKAVMTYAEGVNAVTFSAMRNSMRSFMRTQARRYNPEVLTSYDEATEAAFESVVSHEEGIVDAMSAIQQVNEILTAPWLTYAQRNVALAMLEFEGNRVKVCKKLRITRDTLRQHLSGIKRAAEANNIRPAY